MTHSLLMLLSLPTAALAQESDDARAADHLAQAEHFVRKGWYSDAHTELQAALALPAGQQSFDVHWLAAQVAWELLDVEGAAGHAASAAALAQDPAAAGAAEALADSYARNFGYLDIRGPHGGLVSRLQVEAQGPIFDAELKRYVNQLSLQLRDRTVLPIRIGLPIGPYLVNGREVTVTAGSDSQLTLPMNAIGARGLAALQVTRLEAGLGVGLLTGARVGNHLPAPVGQLALTQPLGPVLLGLMLDGRLDGYGATRHRTVWPVPTWSAGLRIGREFVLGGPLSFRPSVQYRLGFVPGLGLACEPGASSWSCTPEGDGSVLEDAPLAVYASGLTHRPGVELAVDYRAAGRTTAVGTGVKLVVDQAFGGVPAQGDASTVDGETIAWQTSDAAWTATGVQMLAAFSFAF